MQVATVINKAWLAHARALAESLSTHEPGARLSVLVVDPLEGLVDPAAEPFEILSPDDLQLDDFVERSVRYDVAELCCSLKPALVRHLLRQHETVLYLDSDMRLFAPLALEGALASASFLLTPHLLAPLPEDGRSPEDLSIVLGGAFNAGLFAARRGASSSALLDWWSERLRTGSRMDPGRGLVYDQRWAELLPGLDDRVAIVRDPGLNWGYWRAPQTPLRRDGSTVLAGDGPLRCLHFTGLDLQRGELLSRFDNRTDLDSEPLLRELRDGYVERLLAHGHEEVSSWRYTFAETAGGTRLDPLLRELWDRGRVEGALDLTPFSQEGDAQMIRWLGETAHGSDGLPLSRLLAEVHARDPELARRFPDPRGADNDALRAWALELTERDPTGALARALERPGRSSRPGLRRLAPGEQLGAGREEVAVCIPVYGAIDLFAECLSAVLDHTDPAVPILVADDASPDPGAWRVLEELEGAGRLADREIAYLRQPANLGFPGNVNACFDAAAPADVVVLNSDCVVAAGWLTGLQRAARSDALVATSSALTNHGTILSVPWRNEPQAALPQDKTLAQAARDVMESSLRLYPRLPTAIGHCVLVRRRALDLVGGFDLVFSPGYGEEVDFAQRCLLHGLVHVAADDVLVLHRAGSSFSADGAVNPAQAEHELIVQSRYPYYDRAQTAAARATDTPLARSLSSARRALIGTTATIDARCLGPILTGTQIHTLEVIRALSETDRVHLRVIVPPDLGDHAATVLGSLRNVTPCAHDEIAGSRRTDIAHRPYQVFSLSDLEMLAAAGERTVITHQDLIAYRNPGYFPGYPHWERYQRLTREALALADRVVFFSHHAAADAIREDLVAPERARVVYIGVDHAGDGEGHEPGGCAARLGDRPMLLCLGTDFRHKNRVFAIRLLEALRERHDFDGTLVLAGPRVSNGSSAAEEAHYLATHPTVAEHVLTLAAVSESEKAWLLERCSAVLYPTTFEGFGLMPFEAAAADRPCLFASHTALVETLPPELATLVPWDPAASAERVARLLGDEAARKEHVRDVIRAGERFSWESTGLQLLDIYNEAAAAPAREASRMALDVAAIELEREDYKLKYTQLWSSLTPAAVDLTSPEGPLDESQRSALAAMARRPLTRRLLFGPVLLAHRLLGGRRGRPGDAAASKEQAHDFALHVGASNRSHMREQTMEESTEDPAPPARDWLGDGAG